MALASWRPSRAVRIVAGTPPGGGLDRTARALAAAIAQAQALDVPVEVVNVPGDGARNAWRYMDRHPGDPHVVSISHPNLTSDRLVGLAAFDHADYTPIATLYNEYIAFVAKADSPLRTAHDLLDRLAADASGLSVALSTALGNPNHVAVALVARHAGANVRAPAIRVYDSALDAVATVVVGGAALAAVTAASVSQALQAGAVRVLAVSAPERLDALPDAPTWRELGVPCEVGAWRGLTGAAGIASAHVEAWTGVCERAIATDAWTTALARHAWTPMYRRGAELARFLALEKQEVAAILAELGLIGRRFAPKP